MGRGGELGGGGESGGGPDIVDGKDRVGVGVGEGLVITGRRRRRKVDAWRVFILGDHSVNSLKQTVRKNRNGFERR